nr:hypothetical protein Iba_scaffold1558103CG0010 [Ipomoea batatas]
MGMVSETNHILLMNLPQMFQFARLIAKAVQVSVFTDTVYPFSFGRYTGCHKITAFSLTR